MSPTLIGSTKVMAAIATVATRPLATLAASAPPATSIWESTQPPKISPLPFMSAGCGTVLMIGSRRLSAIKSPPDIVDFKLFSYHTHVVPATKRSPRASEERQEAAMAKNGDLFDRSGGKRTAATKDTSYTARDIEVLEGLEPVRKRPAMYIGGTDERALHHLVAEVLDNAMDEAVAGHADTIYLEVLSGNRVLVRDNGRGIPVDPHPTFRKWWGWLDPGRGIVSLSRRSQGLHDLGDRRALDRGAPALRRRGQERDQRHDGRQGRMGRVVAGRRGRLRPLLLQHRADPRRRHARIGLPQRAGARAEALRRAHGQPQGLGHHRRRRDRRCCRPRLGVHRAAAVPGPDQGEAGQRRGDQARRDHRRR